jgi:hypothetical protein
MTPTADDRGGVTSEPTGRWVFLLLDSSAKEPPSGMISPASLPASLRQRHVKHGVGRDFPPRSPHHSGLPLWVYIRAAGIDVTHQASEAAEAKKSDRSDAAAFQAGRVVRGSPHSPKMEYLKCAITAYTPSHPGRQRSETS